MRWLLILIGCLILTGCGCCGRFWCGFGGGCGPNVYTESILDIEAEVSRFIIDYSTRLRYEKMMRFEDSNTYFHLPPFPPTVDLIRVIYSCQKILELENRCRSLGRWRRGFVVSHAFERLSWIYRASHHGSQSKWALNAPAVRLLESNCATCR